MTLTRWTTKITDTYEDGIYVRGYDLSDLIGRLTFGEMFYLLSRGELPEANVGRMIDAMLVSCADHGIITTSVAARYAIASGTPLQGALAAGVLMIGDIYLGAIEQAARYVRETLDAHPGKNARQTAQAAVAASAESRTRIPGFGHPLHAHGDPRSKRLFALAHELRVAGPAVALMSEVERELEQASGRALPLNADGALAAIALDLGFDWRFTRAFMLLSRTAGILAHADEELREGKPWRVPPPAQHEVKRHDDYYEGTPRRPVPTVEG